MPSIARKPSKIPAGTRRRAPKQSVAIVPVRAEEPNPTGTLPTTTQLPLTWLATASKVSMREFWLKRLSSAESFHRAAFEAIRSAVDDLVSAELAKLAVDGVLERAPMPRNPDADKVWDQRQMLRIRAKEILAQENSDLEPFFRPKPLSDAILRECTLDHRRITKRVCIYHGCLRCRRKDREYGSVGFCRSCYQTIRDWRREVAKHPEVYEVD